MHASRQVSGEPQCIVTQLARGSSFRGWPLFDSPVALRAPPPWDSQIWLRESCIGTLKTERNPLWPSRGGLRVLFLWIFGTRRCVWRATQSAIFYLTF